MTEEQRKRLLADIEDLKKSINKTFDEVYASLSIKADKASAHDDAFFSEYNKLQFKSAGWEYHKDKHDPGSYYEKTLTTELGATTLRMYAENWVVILTPTQHVSLPCTSAHGMLLLADTIESTTKIKPE